MRNRLIRTTDDWAGACWRGLAAGTVALVIAACGGGGDSTGPHLTQVIQIVNSSVEDGELTCTDPLEGAESSYQVTFNLEIVNTTESEVTVTGVSSRGDVVSSTRPNDFPVGVHTFNSLPYTPQPVVLRAHDGDVAIKVTMTVKCGMAVVTSPYSHTIRTTIFVLTTAGLFTSVPLDIRVTWLHNTVTP